MLYKREEYRPSLISSKAGVYVFRDSFGTIIYVGKARNLRKRISNYFRPSRLKTADAKLRSLINSISKFEFFEVKNESESLILESRFIKEYAPQYNILLRDDKRFFLIKVNLKETYPRLTLTRLKKDDGALYFGPFPQAQAIKQTIDFLTRHFNLRSCSPPIPTAEDKKHCHKHFLKHCSAPCDGTISNEDYIKRVHLALDVLNGKVSFLIEQLKLKMVHYASSQKFEKAALQRDIIDNLNLLFKNQRKFSHSRIGEKTPSSLEELQEKLNLESLPFIIEAFDNSHFQGAHTVSSLVRFVDGKPHTSSYRHYKIKTVDGIDDFSSMYEVVHRRYKRVLRQNTTLPNLILIDGGKGQLSFACRAP